MTRGVGLEVHEGGDYRIAADDGRRLQRRALLQLSPSQRERRDSRRSRRDIEVGRNGRE